MVSLSLLFLNFRTSFLTSQFACLYLSHTEMSKGLINIFFRRFLFCWHICSYCGDSPAVFLFLWKPTVSSVTLLVISTDKPNHIGTKNYALNEAYVMVKLIFKFPSLMHSFQVDEHPVKISGQNL